MKKCQFEKIDLALHVRDKLQSFKKHEEQRKFHYDLLKHVVNCRICTVQDIFSAFHLQNTRYSPPFTGDRVRDLLSSYGDISKDNFQSKFSKDISIWKDMQDIIKRESLNRLHVEDILRSKTISAKDVCKLPAIRLSFFKSNPEDFKRSLRWNDVKIVGPEKEKRGGLFFESSDLYEYWTSEKGLAMKYILENSVFNPTILTIDGKTVFMSDEDISLLHNCWNFSLNLVVSSLLLKTYSFLQDVVSSH